MSEDDAEALYLPQMQNLIPIVERLKADLLKLQLSNSWEYYDGRCTVYTTFLHMLKWKEKKTAAKARRQKGGPSYSRDRSTANGWYSSFMERG